MRRIDFEKTVSFRAPEHIIADFGGCPLSSADPEVITGLQEFLGITEKPAEGRAFPEKLLKHYDIDTRGVGNIIMPKDGRYRNIDSDTYIDEWGIVRKFTGQYWDIVESPLRGASEKEVKDYRFPDIGCIDEKELAAYSGRAKKYFDGTDYIICASHPVYGIFELGCWMFGFDDFLYRMAAEPEVIHLFFTRVLEYQLAVSRIYYKSLSGYIHYTSSGDDFATQSSTFFSKAMFEEMIAPYLKERIRVTKSLTEAKFLHHSCGNVSSLIEILIQCGVDILNPIQPCAPGMAPEELKNRFGGNIVFHGGLDTQAVLPAGSPETIAAEVKKLLDVFRGGGYIFAAAHNIQRDVPIKNLNAMLDAVKKYK